MAITIANVVLPQMRGALSATPDQVAWVITFNLVATAVVTPISGWLSNRFGRRRIMLIGTFGFTTTSVLCGLADSLEVLVLYRILQGAFGAPLVPISQAIILDTFPREKHALATALWGVGVVTGPIIGPTFGGFIAEEYSWRWVFFMIVPFGVMTFVSIWAFIKKRPNRPPGPAMDWLGFLALAAALAAFQFMFDRGERNDWFDSPETIIECTIGFLAMYIFLVHISTAKNPFIRPGLFLNRNYSLGLVMAFFFGMINFVPLVLMPSMLQDLRGYPDSTIGVLLAIRGAGNMLSFLLVIRMAQWNVHATLTFGFLCQAVSGYAISQFDMNATYFDIAWTGALQGLGIGMSWVPLTLIMFSTVKPEFLDDASAIFHMLRNFGSSLFISVSVAVVIHSTYINGLELGLALNEYSKLLTLPWVTGILDLSTVQGLSAASAEVKRQAATIGFINAFRIYAIVAIIPLPLIWLARKPKPES
ncbi:MAG: MDR family MFS transporter [Alphaproteobacteria bacterium]|nr:MDR family MFS transporter [Alphaproteobacteria bacterium]MDP7055154.1 MDR family MFS transporter [Alphaproteobacteria bacterium]MDP7228042.1 MDR family MFS transporter [Alphaproteobacteria bacterium]MDP7459859.1 MDR family MFS transporter [Alphaproteobacteria bacterium]HJM90439.1 MDR family MFS transporter [Alphaproteobacteria bacterium]